MSVMLKDKKIIVTGGKGFLGRYIVKELERKDCKDIFIPKRQDFDLRSLNAVKKMYEAARADIVIHLATVAGGDWCK